jgi:hypothetical protein
VIVTAEGLKDLFLYLLIIGSLTKPLIFLHVTHYSLIVYFTGRGDGVF